METVPESTEGVRVRAPANSERPPFLRLPQELRDIIYAYVRTTTDLIATTGLEPREYQVLPPHLNKVCRQMHNELPHHFSNQQSQPARSLAGSFWGPLSRSDIHMPVWDQNFVVALCANARYSRVYCQTSWRIPTLSTPGTYNCTIYTQDRLSGKTAYVAALRYHGTLTHYYLRDPAVGQLECARLLMEVVVSIKGSAIWAEDGDMYEHAQARCKVLGALICHLGGPARKGCRRLKGE
ncbi:hypothetical protein LTR85_005628 [Meristemomyces frigidus]|nr:hypothetical protein LTR85_005628 [Meristemomyces frigidus]